METLRQLCPGRKLPENPLEHFLIYFLQALRLLTDRCRNNPRRYQAFSLRLLAFDPAMLCCNSANFVSARFGSEKLTFQDDRIKEDLILEKFEAAEVKHYVLAKLMEIGQFMSLGCLNVPQAFGKPALERRRTPMIINPMSIEHKRVYLRFCGPIEVLIKWNLRVMVRIFNTNILVISCATFSSCSHWPLLIDLGHFREQAPAQCSG